MSEENIKWVADKEPGEYAKRLAGNLGEMVREAIEEKRFIEGVNFNLNRTTGGVIVHDMEREILVDLTPMFVGSGFITRDERGGQKKVVIDETTGDDAMMGVVDILEELQEKIGK